MNIRNLWARILHRGEMFSLTQTVKKLEAQMPSDIVAAHKHSSNHRVELLESSLCGCFYCLETFSPKDITEWIDDGACAVCPKCGIDSVIGDKSGYPITKVFLSEMHKYWFS